MGGRLPRQIRIKKWLAKWYSLIFYCTERDAQFDIAIHEDEIENLKRVLDIFLANRESEARDESTRT